MWLFVNIMILYGCYGMLCMVCLLIRCLESIRHDQACDGDNNI